jgi:hypothetical protein
MVWLVNSVHYREQSCTLSLALESFMLLNTFLSLCKHWFRIVLHSLIRNTVSREIILAKTCFWNYFPWTINLFRWFDDVNLIISSFLSFLHGFNRHRWMVWKYGKPLFMFEIWNRVIRLSLSLSFIWLIFQLNLQWTCRFFSTFLKLLWLCFHSTFLKGWWFFFFILNACLSLAWCFAFNLFLILLLFMF